MKVKRSMASGILSATMWLTTIPAMAEGSYVQNQFDSINSSVPGIGFGYTQGNSFKVAVPVQQDVHVKDDQVGFNYDFQNTNLVGVSGGVGVALGIQGSQVAVDVKTGQGIVSH